MVAEAHINITALINTFKDNENHYLTATYSEAEVRKDFIDKFFTILGWDVDHHLQTNPFQQEVKVEKAQRQQGSQSQKRADYAFALAPDYKKTQFFVEAKKPSRLLRQNKEDYFQTAKYGWNSQTGISILTDFQEFIIIDCRFKPDFDTILKNEIKYYHYTDFLDPEIFQEVYWLFSREALLAGNLTTFIENLPKPKGKDRQLKLFAGKYLSIDESFLAYIDDIRLLMAQAFYTNNPQLDNYELTEATQRTIDRLVFMRFLEDKQIEPEDVLQSISTATHSWQKFIETSKRLDAKYNGVVFKNHFIDQKDFLGADEVLFKNIATEFDHTNSPYDFNYIPIHILGNIYERFLGKIITVENNKASIELKPEVRKAGGVFYTPKYIVDYIVANTIGKLIENKTPKEIAQLTFADIACGSGSFLIGIFDYLLEYHKKYYNENPEIAKKEGCIFDVENNIYVLSIKQKQNILTNNVYGVDIDLQATEVSQVSLFLKLLEDETMTTANDMQVLFAEKILPDLSHNIKCGNSLIGTEILFDKLEFGKEELRKLNPFDFETAFPKIFSSLRGTKQPGFDAVVGNPPYVKELGSKELFRTVQEVEFGKKYYQGKMDFWYFFVHKGINILKNNGLFGIITNSYWMMSAGASIMINRLKNETSIIEIVYFDNYKVFEDVNGKHNILIFKKGKNENENLKYKFIDIKKPTENIKSFNELIYSNKDIFSNSKIILDNSDNIFKNCKTLNDYYEVSQGVVEATDKLTKKHISISEKDNIKIGDGVFVLNSNEIDKLNFNEEEIKLLKPYVNTLSVKRYALDFGNEYLLYLGKKEREDISKGKYPNIKNHLDNFKEFITSSNAPYGIHRTRDQKYFEEPKLICKGMFLKPEFYYDDEKYYCGFSFSVIIQKNKKHSLKFLLGLMNSNVGSYWFNLNGKKRGIGVDIGVKVFRNFPIPKITPKNQPLHDSLVKLVEQMLHAKQQEQTASTAHEKNLYKNLTESLDFKINNVVYQLYNLTPEEIDVVESN